MNITTEKLINQLSEELYGYEVHVKDIYVEITKTILKVKGPIEPIEVKENFDIPMKPNIKEYRFCKCITLYKLKALYEHNGFKGLREELEGMIRYYMDKEKRI